MRCLDHAYNNVEVGDGARRKASQKDGVQNVQVGGEQIRDQKEQGRLMRELHSLRIMGERESEKMESIRIAVGCILQAR